jgi:branched-chain amino acid transport system substrate-binding protein
MKRRSFVGAAGLAATSAGMPLLARAQTTQGVSKNEIVIGTIQDLSGPIVSIGKPLLNGMNMRIEQINSAGGVNGRKIKLLVEDSGYDPKRAVLAAQKLVTSDRVFAMVNVLGTAVTLATAPVIVDKGILNLFPISAHRGNWEPFHKLKFAILTPFEVGIKAGLNEMIKRRGYKRVAILYQDDELGQDILRATEEVLKEHNMPLVEKASFKRGATDFASQAQRLVAAKPDTIVMATATRESIGGATAARLLGYTGDFLGSSASFQADVAKLGGPPLEGFYAIGEYPMMYRDDPKNSKELNEWMDAYNTRFSTMPDVYSATGWASIDLFAAALRNAGAEPTTDSMVNALQSVKYGKTFLGNPDYAFGPARRLGGAQIRVSQVKGSRWVPFTDDLPL